MSPLEAFLHEPRVAYFSMEIALESAIPTYAGGLGVLAGDTVRAAADLELPLVAVSLVLHGGHFRQAFDEAGRQVEQPAPWEPSQHATPLAAKVALTLGDRQVWVGGWLYVLRGHLGGQQPVLLLDTDLEENHPEDRRITHELYGDGAPYRLCQEAVLGIGGVVAFVVGYGVIVWFLKLVSTRGYMPFVVYRIALGVAVFGLLAAGVLSPI